MFRGIVFDMDGTLIKWINSWDAIREKLGLPSNYKELIKTLGYREAKMLELEHWKSRRIRKDEIDEALNSFEMQNGLMELMPELKKRFIIAVITGAPDVIAERVGALLGIDEVYCNRIVFDRDGYVNDFILDIDEDNKGEVLRKFAKRHSMSEKEIIAVGDAGNDVSMFRVAGLSIAFNPKSTRTANEARIKTQGDFVSVYDAIMDNLK